MESNHIFQHNVQAEELSQKTDPLRNKQIWYPSAIEQKQGDGLSDLELQQEGDSISYFDNNNTNLNIGNQINLSNKISHQSIDLSTKMNKPSLYMESPKASEQAIESDFKKFRDAQKKKTTFLSNINSQFDRGDTKKKSKFEKDEEGGGDEDNENGLIQFLRHKQETLNKQYNLFLRTINIKKFMNTLKRKSRKLLFKYLTKNHFDIIGDNASDYDFYRFNDYLYYKDSTIKMIWDTFFIVLFINIFFYIPLHNSLGVTWMFYEFICNNFMLFILPLEIMVNLNTVNLIQQQLLQQKREFAIMILYYLSIQNRGLKNLDYVIYIRLLDVLRKQTKIQENYSRNSAVSVSGKVIKLILILLFIAHLSACWFIQIGQMEKQSNKKNWIDVSAVPSMEWVDIYITGVYWAAITMVTLGYGDIVPITTIERSYVIVMSLISCGIFAYSFNQIGEILQEIERNTLKLKSKMKKINYLMYKRGIDTQLQTRIRKYFEYYFKEELNSKSNCKILLENLTSKLKEEVLKDLYAKKLKNHKIFYLNFSSQVLEALSLKMKELNLVAEEYIFRKSEYDDKIYILISGELELVCNENNPKGYTLLRRYSTEEVIGEEEFFHNSRKRQYSLKATNISCVAYLTRDDFAAVLSEFPEDYITDQYLNDFKKQYYRQLKDKISLYDQYQTLGLKCIVCDNFHHKYDSCPYLHIEDRKQIVLEQANKSFDQQRVKVERNIKKYNSRINHDIIKKTVRSLEYNQSQANFNTDSEEDNEDGDEESYSSQSQPNDIRARAISQNISQSGDPSQNISKDRRRSQFVERILEDEGLSTIQSMNSQEIKTSSQFQFMQSSNQQPTPEKKQRKRQSEYVNPTQLKNLTQNSEFKRYKTIGPNNNNNNNSNNNSMTQNMNTSQQSAQCHSKSQSKNTFYNEVNISQASISKFVRNLTPHHSIKITEIDDQMSNQAGSLNMSVKREGRRKSTNKLLSPIIPIQQPMLQILDEAIINQNIQNIQNISNIQGMINKQNMDKMTKSMTKKGKEGQRPSIYNSNVEQMVQFLDDYDPYQSRFCLFDIEEKFDSYREYVRYFPSNNMSTVLKQFFLNQIHAKCKTRKGKKKKFQKEQIVRRKNTLRQSTKIIPSKK